jgi:hypothetical protein
MDFSAYNADGSPYKTLNYDFNVCVSNDQWFVKTVWPQSYSVEHGGDGKSVYGVIYDPSSSIGVRPANITSGMYPLVMDPYNRVLWLAFASSSYISSKTNDNMPSPWASPFKEPWAYAYGVEVERSKIAPGLPIHLKFIANKKLISSAANNTNLDNPREADVVRLSNIHPGFVGGEYIAKETTNYDGLEIPLEFNMILSTVGFKSRFGSTSAGGMEIGLGNHVGSSLWCWLEQCRKHLREKIFSTRRWRACYHHQRLSHDWHRTRHSGIAMLYYLCRHLPARKTPNQR